MYSRILVALDGSPGAGLALNEALRIAEASKGTLIAVSVVEHRRQLVDPTLGFVEEEDAAAAGNRATLALRQASALCEARGVPCVERVLDAFGDDAATTLVRVAAECDAELIVMGTRGLHGVKRMLLGSTAEHVLRTADCPVLVVRQSREPAGGEHQQPARR